MQNHIRFGTSAARLLLWSRNASSSFTNTICIKTSPFTSKQGSHVKSRVARMAQEPHSTITHISNNKQEASYLNA